MTKTVGLASMSLVWNEEIKSGGKKDRHPKEG